MKGHKGFAVAVVAAVALASAGCDREKRSDSDQRYGAAPAKDSAVTYQPEVVFVGGGSASIRSVAGDALTWRIDPRAKHADELAKGKIMFLTGRAVGRVLDLKPEGDDLAVTLGPVDITDVIREGTFKGEDRPIDLGSPTRYEAGEPFWSEYDVDESEVDSNGPRLASVGNAAKFNVTPICCSGGVGAGFTYDGGGIRLAGKVQLLMAKPSASFHLEIHGGKVGRAELQVAGMAGLRVEIAGATNIGQNVNKQIPIPVDFSVPIGTVLGVPFAATVNQIIGVQTAFSAKDGNLKAEGEWSLSGALGFGYANGSFGVHAPRDLKVKSSLTDSIYGPSVGVSGIIVSYQAAFRVGLGAFGFTAGLYFKFTMTVGLSVGSALGAPIELCRSAQVGIWAAYGVGYTIPAGLVKVINQFLSLLNVAPVPKEAGIGNVENVFNRMVIQPDVPICRA
jgi:hypothetical protein